MPERWERELRKLDGVEPSSPAIVRERAAHGSRPAGPRPRRERLAAGIVAGIVSLAAGAFALGSLLPSRGSGSFATGSWPVVTVRFSMSAEGDRTATLTTPSGEQEGLTGAATQVGESYPYSWLSPSELVIGEPVEIPMGSELELEGDVRIEELLYGDAGELDAGAGPDSGPIWSDQPDFSEPYFLPWHEQPDREYLKFFGTWGDGHVLDVYFEVRFVAPPVDLSDTTAEISVTPEPMEAAFLYGGQRSPIGVEGGTYGNMSVTAEFVGFDERSIVAKVPAGTPFEVVGPDLVEATLQSGSLPLGEDAVPLDGVLPDEPGRYVLRLDVEWGGGSASFLHQIEVVPASEPSATVQPSPRPGQTGSVVIEISRESPETGDPEAIARFVEREIWMCPDGWSMVDEDGTTDHRVFDCGQEDVFAAPAGAMIRVVGNFATIDPTARVEGSGPVATDVVPDVAEGSVVFLQLPVTWEDGSAASFWLQLTVAAGTAGDLGVEGETAPALRVRCGPDGAEVLTPVVAAQADGLHIVPVEVSAGWEIGLWTRSDPRTSWWSGSDGVDDGFARPIPPGEASVACHRSGWLSETEEDQLRRDSTPFRFEDPGGFYIPHMPGCEISDQMSVHWSLEGIVIDDAEDRLKALPGVLETDVIELAGYDHEWGSRRTWRIVRDGSVVAAVWVGEQAGGTAFGWVCRSSGIVGNEI